MSLIKHHKLEIIILVMVLATAAWLRLYRISEYMTFLGDEGRDARVVRKLLVDKDPVLIGPMTSVVTSQGHMYLGPLYYYLMAPAMALAGLSPVGPAVMVAIFSLATICMIWWLGRKWWGPVAGLSAAVLYAVSPTVIIYSRSSWNPNIMPFFALLGIWSIYEVWKNKRYKWLLLTGFCLAFVLQSHYLGLLLVPVLFVFWFWSLVRASTNSKQNWLIRIKKLWGSKMRGEQRIFWQYTIWGIIIFLFLMSPLLIFDLRHDWLNFNAMKAFFTERQTTVHFKFYEEIGKFYPLLEQIYGSMLTAKDIVWARVVLGVTGLVLLLSVVSRRTPPYLPWKMEGLSFLLKEGLWEGGKWTGNRLVNPLLLILIWLLVGVFGLTLYQQTIFDHYFGFLYPVPFLLTGWVVNKISNIKYQISKKQENKKVVNNLFLNYNFLIASLLLSPLLYLNLLNSPLRQEPNRQLQKSVEISEKIIEESGGQPFNLALISRHNYDEAYRYILEWKKAKLVEISPNEAENTITEQLFVVCENQPPYNNRDDECDPIAHPRSEIALFGWVQIEDEWNFEWGHKLYKLVPLDGS